MIKTAAVELLSAPPIWPLLRKRALRNHSLTVLCFHTIGPDSGGVDGWTVLRENDFRTQLAAIKRYYEIVSLDEGIQTDPSSAKPRAVITFDDGDVGLYTHLLPILRKTPVPVTIYVATAQIENNRPFWFDRVVNALQQPCEIHVEGLGRWVVPEAEGKIRWQVLEAILQALKETPADRRDALADQVAEKGGPPPVPALGPMTREQLAKLAATPCVTIGAHSHGHELLDQVPLEQATESICRSRNLLREWTGRDVSHFAFPNGNHSTALRSAVKELGFATAAILQERPVPRGNDPFAIPRISIGRYDSLARMKLRLVGL